MRNFDYVGLKNQKWDSETVAHIAAIHEAKGRQELYLKQKPQELDKLVEIARIQSTEISNEIEGIRTTNTRLKQLLCDKITATRKKLPVIAMPSMLFARTTNISPLRQIISYNYTKFCTAIPEKVSAAN